MKHHLSKCGKLFGWSLCLAVCAMASGKTKKTDSDQARAQYVSRLQQQYVDRSSKQTIGSLWTDDAPMGDISSDYKAHSVNDLVTIQVAVQTTAAQSGIVDSERSFSTTSAITGVMGKSPASTNPLLAGNSSSVLKGQGSTASNTQFATNMTGQVIAVLPNGNLIVEARRDIFMNNQHEHVIVRGMIRPGDIGAGNIVPSAALSNLEIEMKGKGIIADGVRPPNPLTRAILWLLNF